MKFSFVLRTTIMVWNLVQLSSSLSDVCEMNVDEEGQGLIPVQIDCTVFLNGTLNVWWYWRDRPVEKVVSIDYNCTGIGDVQLYSFVSDGNASTAVDLLPSISNFAMVEPTCYVDGCYESSKPRRGTLTYIIPTVTCTGITFPSPIYDGSKDRTTKMNSIVTPTSSMFPVSTLEPIEMQGGLKQYIWFVFVLVPGIAVFLLILALCIRWRRQKREWWCKAENKDLLLGNEPCVDPLAYRESDYCESATIVDPLDIHEHGQNHVVTTVIYDESLFVEDFKQQAGDSDNHSLSGGSDTSESGSMPLESDGNGQAEKDNSSTCTQTVDHDAAVGAHPSDSEEERLLITTADNARILNKGAKHNVKPIPIVPQENGLSSTAAMKTSNEKCKDLLPSTKPAATSEHAMPGGLPATGLGDKTHCTSSDGATWKSLCDSKNLSTPEYIPSSEHSVCSGNGTSSMVNSSDDDTEIINLMSAEDMMNASPVKDCHSKISIPEKQADASNFTNGVEEHVHKGVDGGEHCSNPNSPHNRQHEQEQQSQADYISSSDYSTSVYSSERSAATTTTTDYLADIEDIADADQCSMQSDLAAVEETPGGLVSNSEEERINCHYPKAALLQDVTNCQLHLFLPDGGHHYCTMVNPAETPGSSSSGYVEVSPRQNHNTSVNNIYEVMIQQEEPSNSSHSGYLSTVCNEHTRHVRNYQYETTV